MFTDADTNEDTKSASLLADATDDSCRLEYIEIVPLARDTDGPCTTDCDSGDWSAHVKQENMTVVKQEPADVCGAGCVSVACCYLSYEIKKIIRIDVMSVAEGAISTSVYLQFF